MERARTFVVRKKKMVNNAVNRRAGFLKQISFLLCGIVLLSLTVEIIQNILPVEPPMSAEFAALEFSCFGKQVNGRKRNPEKIAHFFNRHYSSTVPELAHNQFHVFAVALNSI